MELISQTLGGGGPNPHCAGAENRPPASAESQRTLGALFSFGGFSFLNLGDLDWDMVVRAELLRAAATAAVESW